MGTAVGCASDWPNCSTILSMNCGCDSEIERALELRVIEIPNACFTGPRLDMSQCSWSCFLKRWFSDDEEEAEMMSSTCTTKMVVPDGERR